MIPFSVKKYNTGKYNVVTRSGGSATITRMIYDNGFKKPYPKPNWVVANVPTVKDCLGNTIYGYCGDGRRKHIFKDPLDLMLVPKITWCQRIKSLFKRLR